MAAPSRRFGVSGRDFQNVARTNSAAYPATPIPATGIPSIVDYSLRFTMSQLNFWLKSQNAVADFA